MRDEQDNFLTSMENKSVINSFAFNHKNITITTVLNLISRIKIGVLTHSMLTESSEVSSLSLTASPSYAALHIDRQATTTGAPRDIFGVQYGDLKNTHSI
jgi:hypothetical protein